MGTPVKDIFSSRGFAELGGSDIDCLGLWGNPSGKIVIGGGGFLAVRKCDGADDTIDLTGYPAGHAVRLQVDSVYSSGTTCPGVVVYPARVSDPVSATPPSIDMSLPTSYVGLEGWWGATNSTLSVSQKADLTTGTLTAYTQATGFPDPLGGNTAMQLLETAVGGAHQVLFGTFSPASAINGDVEYDIYIKPVGADRFCFTGHTFSHCGYTTPTLGVLSLAGTYMVEGSVEILADGWNHLRLTGAIVAAIPNCTIGGRTSTTFSYTGDVAKGILLANSGWHSRQRSVTSWADSSSNARHATNVLTTRPVLTREPISGGNWCGSVVANAKFLTLPAGAYSIFGGSWTWGCRIDIKSIAAGTLDIVSVTGATGLLKITRSTDAIVVTRTTDAGVSTPVAQISGGLTVGIHQLAYSYNSATGDLSAYLDGGTFAVMSLGVGAFTPTAGTLNFSSSRVQEMFLYSGVKTRTEVEAIQAGIVARNA